MQARSAAATLGAFALALLVAGCATGPSAPRASSGGKAATPLEARGRYEAAADAWLKAAAGLQGSRQAEARLRAAEDYEKAKKPQAAWRAIEPMAISDLPPKERFDGALTKARLALAVHRPQDALAALAAAPAPPGRAEQLQFLALKGQVEFAADDPRTGLETLVERGTLVTSQDQVLANDRLIWSELGHASNLPEPQGLSPTAVGWVKLARIQRNAWLAPGEFTQQLQAWRIAYPNHPADYGLLAEIQSRAASFGSYPAQVALLLPLSGPYASQGAAVEHGLLAAYYLGNSARPALAIYDTKGTDAGTTAALGEALAHGANFLIGPLTVAGVKSVAAAQPAVPVLALNYLPGDAAPSQFYQFGLSPEQEAAESARRAAADGLLNAVVLVPANDWGRNVADAFSTALSGLGGQVIASTTYPPGAVDFGSEFSTLFGFSMAAMNAQPSKASAASGGQGSGLQQARRADIQFVFFAAPYTTARLIMPQIRYYQGLGLPVYSLSSVYVPGGAFSDLDGLRFPIMPWFLANEGTIAKVRDSVHSLFPQSWSDLASLYALGYDSWRLVPLLKSGAEPFGWQVRGMTGTLALGPDDVVQRVGAWARFTNGNVEPLTSSVSP